MNKLVEIAISKCDESEKDQLEKNHQRAKIRIKECFGEYADNNLIETNKPCVFLIKDTNWNLVFGLMFECFTLWHKDRKDGNSEDGRFNAWQILSLETLGRSLKSVIKEWGL